MRCFIFAGRTMKELLRDPLSYIFCIGFPIVMLIIMTIVNESIPKEAGMTVFRIDNLAPGIAFFGLTFVMLFTALQVSKDRTTSFMTRLYATLMTPVDFIVGYTIPVVIVALLQQVITFIASSVIARLSGVTLEIKNIILCMIMLLPSAILFIAFGLFFGILLNDKASPGICSIIISAAGMLGGVWMDLEAIGGTFQRVCSALPFYPGVKTARSAMSGEWQETGQGLMIILIYAIVLYILSILVFIKKMKSDTK